jgi:hypothetical protein
MATTTPNYGLTKPDLSELYDIGVQNTNMDLVDTQMKQNADDIDDMSYHAGDTLDLTPGVFAGRLGSDRKTIHFIIPLTKPFGSDVTGFSLPGNFTIFHSSGGIMQDTKVLSTVGTVAFYNRGRSYGLGVRLVLTTASSMTANRPVCLYANSGCTLVLS